MLAWLPGKGVRVLIGKDTKEISFFFFHSSCKRGLVLLSHNIGDIALFFISSNLYRRVNDTDPTSPVVLWNLMLGKGIETGMKSGGIIRLE